VMEGVPIVDYTVSIRLFSSGTEARSPSLSQFHCCRMSEFLAKSLLQISCLDIAALT